MKNVKEYKNNIVKMKKAKINIKKIKKLNFEKEITKIFI